MKNLVLLLLFFPFISVAQSDCCCTTFANYDSLRLLISLDTACVYQVDDNEFYYDPSDNTSADDSAMTLVTVSGGRLKRYFEDRIFPEWFGAIGDGSSNDAVAFNKMFRWMEVPGEARGFTISFKNRVYFFGSDTVFLPVRLRSYGENIQLFISAHGVTFRKSGGGPMFYRMPSGQFSGQGSAAALDIINSYRLTLTGAKFQGAFPVADGSQALKLGAFYSSSINNCSFTSFDTAVVALFWLGCEIKDNRFSSNKSVAIKGASGNGYWTSATTSNSSYNINRISGNRVFNASGSFAGVMLLGADGSILRDHISEGSNPKYDIYYDYANNTVVKAAEFKNVWFESVGGELDRNTCFYIRAGATANIDISGFQNSYSDTLFELSLGSAATLNISGVQYFTNPFFKYNGVSPQAAINLSNMPISYANVFFNQARWQDATIPLIVRSNVDGLKTTGGLLNIEPDMYNIAGNRRVNMKAMLLFGDDNTYFLGFRGSTNSRPQSAAIGTGGIRIDKSATRGFGFGDAAATPVQYWSNVNDSVTRIFSTGSLRLPLGTTSQRPSNFGGGFRWNTESLRLEVNNASAWRDIAYTDDGGEEEFTATSGQTAFNVTGNLPVNKHRIFVFSNGLKVKFSLSGNTVTLLSPASSGDVIDVQWF